MPKLSGQSRLDLKIEKTVKEFPRTIIPEEIRNDHFFGNSIVAKRNLVIKTDEEWENLLTVAKNLQRKLWTLEMLGAGIEIDFSKHQVIAVFDVPSGNSGCNVNIANITEYADSIVVDVHSLVTEHGWTGSTQAYHLVKIPISDKKVVFQKEQINNEGGKFPVRIPFENYGLTGTSCLWQWTEIPLSVYRFIITEGITIVNSNEELENYTVCSGDTFPEIDFSEHTLLLVRGVNVHAGSEVIYTALFEYPAKEYVLKVVVFEGNFATPSSWFMAILMPKIPNGAAVSLDFKLYSY